MPLLLRLRRAPLTSIVEVGAAETGCSSRCAANRSSRLQSTLLRGERGWFGSLSSDDILERVGLGGLAAAAPLTPPTACKEAFTSCCCFSELACQALGVCFCSCAWACIGVCDAWLIRLIVRVAGCASAGHVDAERRREVSEVSIPEKSDTVSNSSRKFSSATVRGFRRPQRGIFRRAALRV
jgi:hypothetical protein